MAREMKDSVIPWVGIIPAEWKSVPNKYVMFKTKVIQPFYKGEDILSLTMNGVIIRDLDAGGKMPSSFDGYQKLTPGNLLMCLFDYDVTPRCIGIIKNNGLTSPAYSQFILRDKNIPEYFYYYYLMVDKDKYILPLAKNLRHSFTEEQLGIIKVPEPSIQEQKKIASFLDSKCSQIDSLVADITKEIELLKEYRKSVIYETVTKGLDPNVEMKDSGIEWIGKIPSNWGITKIKREYDVVLGKMVDTKNIENVSNYLCAANIKWEGVNTEISKQMAFSASEKTTYLLKKGDILIMEGGMAGTTCEYNDEFSPCYIQNSVMRCRPISSTNPKFLYYWMNVVYYCGYVSIICNKATIMHYTKEKVQATPILQIPSSEQHSIVSFLDSKCSQINTIISDKQQQIDKLTEYKKSLIYEYVTGKKEVPAC